MDGIQDLGIGARRGFYCFWREFWPVSICSCDEVELCLSLDKLWSELTARGMEKPSEGQGPQAVFQLQGMMKY